LLCERAGYRLGQSLSIVHLAAKERCHARPA
jgi:hypothetical protein